MELAKVVVFNHRKQSNGLYKILVGLVILSDREIILKQNSESILMGGHNFGTPIIDELEKLDEFKTPYVLGDLSSAVLNISDPSMNPNTLERI